jgi:hypothetical protein
METRASNKIAHPGAVTKGVRRRTTAEVQEERTAKAEAKAAREEAKQRSINRTAEFELNEMANEDVVDTTPRPPFTPKPWPLPRNRKSNLIPMEGTSDVEDVEMTDEFDHRSFVPDGSERSATEDDSGDESTELASPVKNRKAERKNTAKVTTAAAKSKAKTAGKKKVESDIEIVDDAAPVPKPKKVKPRVREAIDLAAKKIGEEKTKGNKYAEMMKATSNKRGTEEPSGQPAVKPPSRPQPTAVGEKRKLEREGAIADIRSLFDEEITAKEPDQAVKRSKKNKDSQNNDPATKR